MSSSIEPFKHWLFDQIQDEKQVYTHEGKDAIRHILQVACGLDSIVVGESPVLGQIREALKEAKDNSRLDPCGLRRVAKELRKEVDMHSRQLTLVCQDVVALKQQVASLEQALAWATSKNVET